MKFFQEALHNFWLALATRESHKLDIGCGNVAVDGLSIQFEQESDPVRSRAGGIPNDGHLPGHTGLHHFFQAIERRVRDNLALQGQRASLFRVLRAGETKRVAPGGQRFVGGSGSLAIAQI